MVGPFVSRRRRECRPCWFVSVAPALEVPFHHVVHQPSPEGCKADHHDSFNDFTLGNGDDSHQREDETEGIERCHADPKARTEVELVEAHVSAQLCALPPHLRFGS